MNHAEPRDETEEPCQHNEERSKRMFFWSWWKWVLPVIAVLLLCRREPNCG
jgi:hypothetical protein